MKQINAKIIKNDKVAPGFYRMRIESSYLAKNSHPGQFVEVKCSEDTNPLLRRPLGVHRIFDGGIEILYEIVGAGTDLLSRKVKGETVDIIGPLGNGFTLHPTPNTLHPILVAGGIGIAPLLALAEHLGYRSKGIGCREKILVLIGARKKEHILCENDFKKLGCKVVIATDDGSRGHKGFVTDLLSAIPAPRTPHPTPIYACGPMEMLKAVAKIAKYKRMTCQVSLEERMACGVGVCLGCPVKVRAQHPTPYTLHPTAKKKVRTQYPIPNTQYLYKMVCKDGPVFNAEEIVW